MKKRQPKRQWWKLLVWLLFFICIYQSIQLYKKPKESLVERPTMTYSTVLAVETTPSPTPTPKPLKNVNPSIEKIILEVFGEHSDKAMLLLTAKECGENKSLDPKAKNHNRNEFGNIDSTDYGIFQINNKWQKITNEAFLFDPEINVRIAWNIYSRDGYSFKLWTCGRALGI